MPQFREVNTPVKYLLEAVAEAQDEGQANVALDVRDLPPASAAQARIALERQGHSVRLTRETLAVAFAPPRLRERGAAPS